MSESLNLRSAMCPPWSGGKPLLTELIGQKAIVRIFFSRAHSKVRLKKKKKVFLSHMNNLNHETPMKYTKRSFLYILQDYKAH